MWVEQEKCWHCTDDKRQCKCSNNSPNEEISEFETIYLLRKTKLIKLPAKLHEENARKKEEEEENEPNLKEAIRNFQNIIYERRNYYSRIVKDAVHSVGMVFPL